MNQRKLRSPILKAGIVSLVLFLTKKYTSYEFEHEFLSLVIDIMLTGVLGLAMFNNPNDRNNF